MGLGQAAQVRYKPGHDGFRQAARGADQRGTARVDGRVLIGLGDHVELRLFYRRELWCGRRRFRHLRRQARPRRIDTSGTLIVT
jgi:hypothetical protein